MKMGVLQTGEVNVALVAEHGEYPEMFMRLFRQVDPDLEFGVWRALHGELPASPAEADVWLVTGSRHGVYEDLPWIEPLKAFLRAAYAAERPILGVCFGHQILAEALGGKVVKSDRGWGIGAQEYALTEKPGWLAGAGDKLRFNAFHQDQVVVKPESAEVLAGSDFCPNAILAYGGAESPLALSIQAHPEFDDSYERALTDLRDGIIAPELCARARDSLGGSLDAVDFARRALSALKARRAQAAQEA